MYKVNPYRPGAGLMPVFLAGRDEEIQEMEEVFTGLSMKIPAQSVIFSGLRGVGKTVLLNALQKKAESKGIFCKHIEIEQKNNFISQIAACSQMFLREVSTKEKFKQLIDKAIVSIKSLIVSFNPADNSISLSVSNKELYQTQNLTQTLTDVFVTLGETAYESNIPICFFIDEIQYMKSEELGSLIAALHRANQLGYPIMMVGAGLPKIYKMLSDEKSYAERLFRYKQIDSLTYDQAKLAITEPVKAFQVTYTDKAVEQIIELTKGYPYFIQEFCKIIYQNSNGKTIDDNAVKSSTKEFFDVLDKGFFLTRYERCSDGEKAFITAMVQCGKLPCTISNVAKNLGKKVEQISPTRGQLINKGIVYSKRYGELDFTVPEFDNFIKRMHN